MRRAELALLCGQDLPTGWETRWSRKRKPHWLLSKTSLLKLQATLYFLPDGAILCTVGQKKPLLSSVASPRVFGKGKVTSTTSQSSTKVCTEEVHIHVVIDLPLEPSGFSSTLVCAELRTTLLQETLVVTIKNGRAVPSSLGP